MPSSGHTPNKQMKKEERISNIVRKVGRKRKEKVKEKRNWRRELNLIFFTFSFLRFINLVPLKIIYFKAVAVYLRPVVCVNIAYFGFIALV